MHRYTPAQLEYLREIAFGKTLKQIQSLFNRKFGTSVSKRAIGSKLNRHKIKTGMQGYTTHFKKGHKAWNKNMKGLQLGGEAGWFQEGQTHALQKPLGAESVLNGLWMVKVDQPNVWIKKHRYIWEQAYGKIPDGYVIRFKDGDKRNCTLDNLFMVSHRAMTSVVRTGQEKSNIDLNVTAHKIAELNMAVKDKEEVME